MLAAVETGIGAYYIEIFIFWSVSMAEIDTILHLYSNFGCFGGPVSVLMRCWTEASRRPGSNRADRVNAQFFQWLGGNYAQNLDRYDARIGCFADRGGRHGLCPGDADMGFGGR